MPGIDEWSLVIAGAAEEPAWVARKVDRYLGRTFTDLFRRQPTPRRPGLVSSANCPVAKKEAEEEHA